MFTDNPLSLLKLRPGYRAYDFDGVLADINHRLEYYNVDNAKFLSLAEYDTPTQFYGVFCKDAWREPVLVLTARYQSEHALAFLHAHRAPMDNIVFVSRESLNKRYPVDTAAFKVDVLKEMAVHVGPPSIFYEDCLANLKAIRAAFPSTSVVRVHDVLSDDNILSY